MAVIFLCLLLVGGWTGFATANYIHWPRSTAITTGEVGIFECGIDKFYQYMYLQWILVEKDLTLYTFEGNYYGGNVNETFYNDTKYGVNRDPKSWLKYQLFTLIVRDTTWADGGTFKCIPMDNRDSNGAQLIIMEKPKIIDFGNPGCEGYFGAPYSIENEVYPSLTLHVNGILVDLGHRQTNLGAPGVARYYQWSAYPGLTFAPGDIVQCMFSTQVPFKWLSAFETISVSAAVEKSKYCNKDLVQKLLTICASVWNHTKNNTTSSELQLNHMRVKLGLHEACCLKGCTDNDILAYC